MIRPRRIFWLLGLVLLVGTAAGAGWVLNHGNPVEEGTTSGRTKDVPTFTGIVCIGYVDVEPGVANLYPIQPGRVVWRADEGEQIIKDKDGVIRRVNGQDDVLLRLDDRLAQAELKRAEASLKDAEYQLAKADLAPKLHDEKVKQLEAAVDAVKAEKAAADQQVVIVKRAFDNKVAKAEELRAAQEAVKKVEALTGIAESKVREAKAYRSQLDLDKSRAKEGVKEKRALVEKARLGVEECLVRAPSEGEVLRVLRSVGDVLGPNPHAPALEFCPKASRIVRAEVQQEFAAKVKEGQDAVIEDDSNSSQRWTGRVKRLSNWFAHRRSIIQEPFQFNDVRTLECLVEVTGPSERPLRIGQRMRVTIKQGGL
jgi:multidrug resistance efflux pump